MLNEIFFCREILKKEGKETLQRETFEERLSLWEKAKQEIYLADSLMRETLQD